MRRLILLFCTATCALGASASAHRDGCHRWHSCPSDRGTYICGDLGYTTYCGADRVTVPAAPVAADPPTPGTGGTRRTTTSVNLRARASAASAKVALLRAGTAVNVLGCAGGWCRVSAGMHTGYVAQPYLR